MGRGVRVGVGARGFQFFSKNLSTTVGWLLDESMTCGPGSAWAITCQWVWSHMSAYRWTRGFKLGGFRGGARKIKRDLVWLVNLGGGGGRGLGILCGRNSVSGCQVGPPGPSRVVQFYFQLINLVVQDGMCGAVGDD